MDSNPYSAPHVAPEPQPQVGGSFSRSLMAILLGGAGVDFLGTSVAVNSLIYLLGSMWGQAGVQDWYFSTPGQTSVMFMGTAFSFLGGFTAASVARRKPVTHAFLAFVVAHLVAVPIWMARGVELTSPIRLIGLTVCLLAVILAGRLVAKLSGSASNS